MAKATAYLFGSFVHQKDGILIVFKNRVYLVGIFNGIEIRTDRNLLMCPPLHDVSFNAPAGTPGPQTRQKGSLSFKKIGFHIGV